MSGTLSTTHFIKVVDGFQIAKMIYAASTLVLVYDFALCIDREIEFFWASDSNNLSKLLYYLVGHSHRPGRESHLSTSILLHSFVTMCPMMCHLWTRFDFACAIFALYLAEVVLVVRVYNLYSGHRKSRQFILIVSIVGGLLALGLIIQKLNTITIFKGVPWSVHHITSGCLPGIPGEFWSVFVPIFISETILFGLTLLRVRESLIRGKSSHPLIRCLVLDGTAFYFGILITVGISLAGSVMRSIPQFGLAAIMSNSLVMGCSLASCRLILSIRTLAARLKYDPDAVFNHLELARIYGNGVGRVMQAGQFGSGIVVEVNNDDMELENLKSREKLPAKNRSATDMECFLRIEDEHVETLGPWRAQPRRR